MENSPSSRAELVPVDGPSITMSKGFMTATFDTEFSRCPPSDQNWLIPARTVQPLFDGMIISIIQ
jgi:hypothetical protein